MCNTVLLATNYYKCILKNENFKIYILLEGIKEVTGYELTILCSESMMFWRSMSSR